MVKVYERDHRLGARSEFTIGVDFGQLIDQTAICVVERRCIRTGETEMVKGMHPWTMNPRAELAIKHVLRGAELLPLKTPYRAVAEHIEGRFKMVSELGRTDVVYDEGGARGSGEMLKEKLPRAIAAVMHGFDDDKHKDDARWSVSKASMAVRFLAAIQNGDLELAALPHIAAFEQHLIDLRRKVSPLGRYSFNAREGGHDDFVTAGGLAYWWSARPPQEIRAVKIAGM